MIDKIRILSQRINVLGVVLSIIFTIFVIVLTNINLKINDLEERNTEVHEYILNKIGG